MNPVKYLWAWLKRHAMANYFPNNLKIAQQHPRRSLPLAGCRLRLGDVMS
jgi:transposase